MNGYVLTSSRPTLYPLRNSKCPLAWPDHQPNTHFYDAGPKTKRIVHLKLFYIMLYQYINFVSGLLVKFV